MPQRIRCRFEVHTGSLIGVPSEYDQVKVVVDHHKVQKRYAATDALPASLISSKQLVDPADNLPLLSFTCHVYPSKFVQVRLMGSSTASRDKSSSSSLLPSGSGTWVHLASAALPLDKLAQQLLLPGVAAAPETPRTSTDNNTSTLTLLLPNTTTAAAADTLEVTSPGATSVSSPPTSPFAAARISQTRFREDAGGNDANRSDNVTTDSAAAAGRVSRSDPGGGAAAVSSDAGYVVEVQRSRLLVPWDSVQPGVVLQQQVIVTAQLLKSRKPGWAQGLFSSRKGSSIAGSSSSRHSNSSATNSGSLFKRPKWTGKLYNSIGAAVGGGGATQGPQSPTSPASSENDHERSFPAAAGAPELLPTSTGTAAKGPATAAGQFIPKDQGVSVAGRLPSFEPWVDSTSDNMPPTAAAVDPSQLPAGHPVNFLGGITAPPAAGQQQQQHAAPTAAAAPVDDEPLTSDVAAYETATAAQQSGPAPAAAAAGVADEPDDDQTAQHEFLQLILATLSSSYSLESEAALPPPSAAQLAAAASLSRAPSAAELAAFAVAAGLPIDKVAEAAASTLGTTTAAGSAGNSARGSPKHNQQNNNSYNKPAVESHAVDTAKTPAALGAKTEEAAAACDGVEGVGAKPAASDVAVLSSSVDLAPAAAAAATSAAADDGGGEHVVTIMVEPADPTGGQSSSEQGAAAEPELTAATLVTHDAAAAAEEPSQSLSSQVLAARDAEPSPAADEVSTPALSADDKTQAMNDLEAVDETAEGEGAEGNATPPAAALAMWGSSSSAAAEQHAEAPSWEPQQSRFYTVTTRDAHTPHEDSADILNSAVEAIAAAEGVVIVSSAGAHLADMSANEAVTSVSDLDMVDSDITEQQTTATDSGITSDSRAEISSNPAAAAAADVVCDHPVYKDNSLGSGLVAEGDATQPEVVNRQHPAVMQGLSEAAAAADAVAASTAAWAAQQGAAVPKSTVVTAVADVGTNAEAANPADVVSDAASKSPPQIVAAGWSAPAGAAATGTASELSVISDKDNTLSPSTAVVSPPAIHDFIAAHPAATAGILPNERPAAAAVVAEHSTSPFEQNSQQQQHQWLSAAESSSAPRSGPQHSSSTCQLVSSSSGTSRLAEVMDRMNSRQHSNTLVVAAAAAPQNSDSWQLLTAAAAPPGAAPRAAASNSSSSMMSYLAPLFSVLAAVMLCIPQLLLSASLAVLKLWQATAATRSAPAASSSSSSTADAWSLASTAGRSMYWGARRASVVAVDALFIPRSIAVGLFSLWLVAVSQLIVKPGLKLFNWAAAAAAPQRNHIIRQSSLQHSTSSIADSSTSNEVEQSASSHSSSSRSQEAGAAAVSLLTGVPGSGAAGGSSSWLCRVSDMLTRTTSSSSTTSSYVPPTPAPSLEVGQSSVGQSWDTWNTRLVQLVVPGLYRSASVRSNSGPATPPSTPLMTPANSAAAPVPTPDDLASTAAAGGSTFTRGLARKSRLGGCGLATIASVTDLAAAAADAAENETDPDTDVSAEETEEPVALHDASGYAAESAGDDTVSTGRSGTAVSASRSWWPSMSLMGSQWSPSVTGGTAAAQSSTGSTAGGYGAAAAWWPGWLWMHDITTSAQGMRGTAPAGATAAPGATAAMVDAGDIHASTAAATADSEGDGLLLNNARAQQRSVYMQLVHMFVVTPAVWYVDAVSFVLRSGVDTAAWLVGLAVWWALLPGRLVWWMLTLPWTVVAAVRRVLV